VAAKTPPSTPLRRLRLYGPSLITLAVLLPFFSYYIKEVKSEQGYLNDRAFRVLDVIARQFGAEINGTHDTMLAAILLPGQQCTLWKQGERSCKPGEFEHKAAIGDIQAYLDTYMTDGEATVEEVAEDPKAATRPGDGMTSLKAHDGLPANEKHSISRSEDSQVFIQLLHQNELAGARDGKQLVTRISAQLDPAKMLARALSNDQGVLFETVFVASREGHVLAQNRNSKVNVVEVETLLESRKLRDIVEGPKNSKDGDSPGSAAQPSLPGEISGADERFDIQVSGTDYVLFVVPAPFVLTGEDGKETPISFYGLMRKDAMESKALRLPSLGMPAIVIAFVIGMAFLWPALKLYTMSDRERLKKSSVVAMCGITLLAAVLLAALYLSYGFFLGLSERSDHQLQQLAKMIHIHLGAELRTALTTSRAMVRELVDLEEAAQTNPANRSGDDSWWPPDSRFPISQLRTNQRIFDLIEKYPFFAHIILTGSKRVGDSPAEHASIERQIIKLSASAIPTPLIAMPQSRFPFVGRLLQGPYNTLENDQFVIQSFISPNTGEFLPSVMFYPGSRPSDALATSSRSLPGSRFRILLSAQLPSLVHVVFPRGFGFAVINQNGSVYFHSDPARNLKENFFSECQNADALKEALRLNAERFLWLHYGGAQVRAFVQPLGASEKPDEGIPNLGLSLIVYCNLEDQEKVLSIIGTRFLVALVGFPLLAFVFAVLARLLRRAFWRPSTITYSRERIWPWRVEKPYYMLEGAWGLFCFLIAVLLAVLVPALILPAVLGVLLIICLGGFALSWMKTDLVKKLIQREGLDLWMERVPLSAAYTARIFAVGLGTLGILSILVFQVVLSSVQLSEEKNDHRSLAGAMKSRAERNLKAFQAVGYPAGSEDLWTKFCAARVRDGFDVYDGRAVTELGNLGTLQSSSLLSLFDEDKPLRALPLSCPPVKVVTNPRPEFEQASLWRALPSPFDRTGLTPSSSGFYIAGLLLLIPIFLWQHLIIRRLFILDYREPEPLPAIDEKSLERRMEAALARKTDGLERLLIFAHPRSGTGMALERIATTLKQRGLMPAEFLALDFGAIASDETADQAKFRQGICEAAAANRIAILDNFEVRLTDGDSRIEKLTLLEALVYAHHSSVYVLTSIEPLLLMESLLSLGPYTDELQAEMNRWVRILGNFERYVFQDDSPNPGFYEAASEVVLRCDTMDIGESTKRELCETFEAELRPTLFLRRCAPHVNLEKLDFTNSLDFEESLVSQLREMADGYYRVIWLNCTSDERLALYQLAKDDWLNPLNKVAISHLLRKRLIGKVVPGDARTTDGAYRLMNVSFRAFVLEAVTERELAVWEKQQNLGLWPALRMALVLSLVLVALFISYVRRDIFDVYFSYFAALAGGGAALLRIVFSFFSKDDPKIASVLGAGDAKGGGQSA
jgi:hypothetical protein